MASRGRTMSRGSSRSRRTFSSGGSTRKVSSSRSVRSANGNDGITRRGYPRAQSYSMYYDPFPRTMRAILRYSDVVSIDAVVGFAAGHVFRAGSIFDPDYTGVGHQPYGHDTYQGIFNHYRVVKSVCKIVNTTPGASNIMSLSLHDDVGIVSDHNLLREMKPGKFIPLNTTADTNSLTMVYNSHQSFPGREQSTTALFGNNPNEEMFFHVSVEGSNTTVNPGAISIVVSIEYYCEFTELKNLGIS